MLVGLIATARGTLGMLPLNRMFYSTTLGCGSCGNGLLAFVLAGDQRTVVLFCLNCGTWYPSVDEINEHWEIAEGLNYDGHDDGLVIAPSGDLVIQAIASSVTFPPARWATADEVKAFGWERYLDLTAHNWRPEQADWWRERVLGILDHVGPRRV